MSQTTGNGRGQFERLQRNHLQLTQMIKQGRSFSGYERNCCFLNLGQKRFVTASAISGLDYPDDGRAVALVDWDQDGDLDLWVLNRTAPRVRFLRNETSSTNHSLAIQLEGNGVTSNRDAIGARVEVVSRPQLAAGSKTDSEEGEIPSTKQSAMKIQKTLRAGEGFLAQSSKRLHFGLGAESDIAQLRVRWPEGSLETFDFPGLETAQAYRLVQGSGRAQPLASEPRVMLLQPSSQPTAPVSDAARIPLVTLLPGPPIDVTDKGGSLAQVGTGKPVLVNLWASWCPSCVEELKEMTIRREEIHAAGLQIIALAADGLGGGGGNVEDAVTTLKRISFPFPSRQALAEELKQFQDFHDSVINNQRRLPVPTSFLYDAQGRITVIYKGPVSVDELLADIGHEQRSRSERREHAALLPGQMIQDRRASLPLDLTEAFFHVELGFQYDNLGRLEEAEEQFREALSIMPEYAYAHYHLGISQQRQGKEKEARGSFQAAVRIDPDHAKAHLNLGVAFYRLKHLGTAKRHLEHAVRSDPSLYEAHYNLGNLLYSQNQLVEAMRFFQSVIEIYPEFSLAHARLGDIYAKQNNPGKALDCYREAKRITPQLQGIEQDLQRVSMKLDGNEK